MGRSILLIDDKDGRKVRRFRSGCIDQRRWNGQKRNLPVKKQTGKGLPLFFHRHGCGCTGAHKCTRITKTPQALEKGFDGWH
jgi:hypothetical protein